MACVVCFVVWMWAGGWVEAHLHVCVCACACACVCVGVGLASSVCVLYMNTQLEYVDVSCV